MPTVVGVRLRFSKTLWFDPAELELDLGDTVVVETDRGKEIGTIAQESHEVETSQLHGTLKRVLRAADESDFARLDELARREHEAMGVFRELVETFKLDMKPAGVEYAFEGEKVTCYFSSEERVDFRDLVRELSSRLHTRVDMRQVGVRDEARAVGGVGHCGQMLCCARMGGDFQPVSIRMAKEQDLPLNPLKISGLCGRLMCCLRYEFEAYKDYKSRAPRRGAMVTTPSGSAKVVDLNTPKETVGIRLEDGTNVAVPLASMSCSKGGSCPCSVSAEEFERLTGPVAVPVMPSLIEKTLTVGAEEEAAAAPSAGARRKRRRPKPDQASGSASKAAEAPKEQPKGGTEAGEASGRVPRRRRRRRSSEGGSQAE